MVVRHAVGDVRVAAAVGVRGLHLQDGGSDSDVFVNVVGLVIWQLELWRVVVDVGHPDGELDRGGEAATILSGGHQQLVDVRLPQVLEIQFLRQLDNAGGRPDIEGSRALWKQFVSCKNFVLIS